MSDLISRLLENWSAWGAPTDRDECVNEKLMAMDCKEAADEIKRLRATNTTSATQEVQGAKEAATVSRPYTGDNGHLEVVAPAGRSLAYLVQYVGTHYDTALWWRPNGAGYTSNVDEAGRFDEAKARGIEKIRGEEKAWPESEVLALAHRVVATRALPSGEPR